MGEDSKVPPLSRRVPGATAHSRPAGRAAPPKLPESLLRNLRAALDAEPKQVTDQANGAPAQPSPTPANRPSPIASDLPSPTAPDRPSLAASDKSASLPRRVPGTTYGPKPPARSPRPTVPTSVLRRLSERAPTPVPEPITEPIPVITQAVVSSPAGPAVDEAAAAPGKTAQPGNTAQPGKTAPQDHAAKATAASSATAAAPARSGRVKGTSARKARAAAAAARKAKAAAAAAATAAAN